MATKFQELSLITPEQLSLPELYKEVSYSRAAAVSRLKYYERSAQENPACAVLFASEVAALRAKLGRIDSLISQAQNNGLMPVHLRMPRACKTTKRRGESRIFSPASMTVA